MNATQNAHVEQVFAALIEWQRRAINWRECLRRSDVTRDGEWELEGVVRTMEREFVREIAERSVLASTQCNNPTDSNAEEMR